MHGYLPSYSCKKKFKTRICIIIPTPYNIRLTHVEVEAKGEFLTQKRALDASVKISLLPRLEEN